MRHARNKEKKIQEFQLKFRKVKHEVKARVTDPGGVDPDPTFEKKTGSEIGFGSNRQGKLGSSSDPRKQTRS